MAETVITTDGSYVSETFSSVDVSHGASVTFTDCEFSVLSVSDYAHVILDACRVVGPSSTAVVAAHGGRIDLKNGVTIGGWSNQGLIAHKYGKVYFVGPGTYELLGPGTGKSFSASYHSEMVVTSPGVHLRASNIQIGMSAEINSCLQHYQPNGSITLENTFMPPDSAAFHANDVSTLSCNQPVTVKSFAVGWRGWAICYLEAMKPRNTQNVRTLTQAAQGSVISLP